ncbi:hypothetical protein RBG61_09890 [Paludicola sp. MB14-C6]|uniref:hypothetical protein n=1 Tax=Paludihabitans sp. MB14-C6 TaxID=3070656 RepID=UPI0027DCCA2C|nr:hypothetical protein [Paludicola sp. MB14-C6]WMJ22297.1 hypothetical protein RBG61_09890 [Paludicola sp. MB14-C6]
MKKSILIMLWSALFLIFYICTGLLDSPSMALYSNAILLGVLLICYYIFRILRLSYIPKHNIITWLALTLVSVPFVIGLSEVGIMPDSTKTQGINNGKMEYLFFIPINLGFVICMCIENVIGRYLLHIRD